MTDKTDDVQVVFYRVKPTTESGTNIQFHLPREKMSFSWGKGEGTSPITVKNEENGNQLIQIFVVGDTPWSSLSEYRVINNRIYPLRHAMSNPWFLLGVLISPLLTFFIQKPVAHAVNRLVGIKSANANETGVSEKK